MQSLLAAQPGMASFPETQFFLLVPAVFEKQPIAESEFEQMLAGFSRHLRISESAADALRHCSRDGKLLAKVFFEQIVHDQIARNTGAPDTDCRWVEKSPWHAFYMERILACYPQARFVFMQRHPCHAFASRRSVNGVRGPGWEGWRPVEAYADEWMAMMRVMEQFRAVHADSIMLVRLESLAERPHDVLDEVCRFCGIDFSPESIDGHRLTAPALFGRDQPWKASVAEMPVSASIANRENRPGLSDYEQYRVAALLGKAAADYGYSMDAARPSRLGPEEIDIAMRTADFYRARLRAPSQG